MNSKNKDDFHVFFYLWVSILKGSDGVEYIIELLVPTQHLAYTGAK